MGDDVTLALVVVTLVAVSWPDPFRPGDHDVGLSSRPYLGIAAGNVGLRHPSVESEMSFRPASNPAVTAHYPGHDIRQ